MKARLKYLMLHPQPLRLLFGKILHKLKLLSYCDSVELFLEPRPHYAYILLRAAQMAQKLKLSRISVIEFGVAGGNGILNLEYHASKVKELTGVTVEIYGFDTGEGLPEPQDYRDLPYHWKAGFFKMDKEALLKRVNNAKIIFGDVKDTVPSFVKEHNPAPIAAISHDLDFYSSTMDAMGLFDVAPEFRLPRIYTYFDDVLGDHIALYNKHTGQLAAIEDYNAAHEKQKIEKPNYLLRYAHHDWTHKIYAHHDFDHPRYNDFVSDDDQQLSL